MFERLRQRISSRRLSRPAAPSDREVMAQCTRCHRSYARPTEWTSSKCWWCTTMVGPEEDPYLDLGGGD